MGWEHSDFARNRQGDIIKEFAENIKEEIGGREESCAHTRVCSGISACLSHIGHSMTYENGFGHPQFRSLSVSFGLIGGSDENIHSGDILLNDLGSL